MHSSASPPSLRRSVRLDPGIESSGVDAGRRGQRERCTPSANPDIAAARGADPPTATSEDSDGGEFQDAVDAPQDDAAPRYKDEENSFEALAADDED